jgi:enoyl-CoA hydratase
VSATVSTQPAYDGYTTLRFERSGPANASVLTVTIDNPASEMNVVDEALHTELARLFRELNTETTARCIVLRGSKRAFCAGGDFSWFPQLRDIARLEALRVDAKAIVWNLLDVPVPIVCALHGSAMGLGASIAVLCDAIVMADDAKLGDPHVRVGIVAGDGGAAIWPLAVGPAVAKRYLLTGDPLDAATALRLGLVTDVVPAAALGEATIALASRIAAMAPLALRATKQAVNAQVKQALSLSFDASTNAELVTFLSADHAEALAAISERRAPVFEGR